MKRLLAIIISLLAAGTILSAQESKDSLQTYFQRLKAFPKVHVVELPVKALVGDNGSVPEITTEILQNLSEKQIRANAKLSEGASINKTGGSLEVISIPAASELEAEQQLLVEEIFKTEEFSDVVLTTKVRESNEAVSLFIPKEKTQENLPIALYILITEGQNKMIVRLKGNYAVNTTWHITDKERRHNK